MAGYIHFNIVYNYKYFLIGIQHKLFLVSGFKKTSSDVKDQYLQLMDIFRSFNDLDFKPKNSQVLVQGPTVFTDISGKTGKAIVTWKDESEWQVLEGHKSGSAQLVELKAVAMAFQRFPQARVHPYYILCIWNRTNLPGFITEGESHLPQAKVWILGYSGYLQGVFALTCNTKSRMGPTGNLRMMIGMPILNQMVLLQVENEHSIFSFVFGVVGVDNDIGGYLIVKVSHQVKALLTERASKWMTSTRLSQYESCLMEQEDIELKSGERFNLASCLNSPEEEGQEETYDCIQVIDLQIREAELAQTLPLGFAVHNIQPGDRVVAKEWKEAPLVVKWHGHFQVLLTTETAIKTAENRWTYHTWVKVSEAPGIWISQLEKDGKSTLQEWTGSVASVLTSGKASCAYPQTVC
ncbi:hypothetical protein HGM15179_018315 [Zosterops borbonicus]|uniref:Uncharacterized protein n=1 Tax=Zosterops borbonicus TaxID=364589 RepID=A0A8K1FZ93_9PASS|nr:hypothetical protein HGM15179_018315 [Zosterops borbonicus]